VCSLNCIYCECGSTTNLTLDRREYVPVDQVFGELDHYFKNHPDPEHVTLSGAGEPTLHSRVGDVIRFIKEQKPGISLAVLTNGTLLADPDVRHELMAADLVIPSLDAATDKVFRSINRPPKGLDVKAFITGLAEFRKGYAGKIWLEVFILPGINDDGENLEALRKAIISIQPDRVQLNTLDRPGVVKGLRAATREELERIAARWDLEKISSIGDEESASGGSGSDGDATWNLEKVEIVLPSTARHAENATRSGTRSGTRSDARSAILETISRRPCTAGDIMEMTGIGLEEVKKQLADLERAGRVRTVQQERGLFYRIDPERS
jgi:wyosine [tRNA(Phe)-imidazoG37] synthetase (radical SAM superfamily)